VYNIPSDTCDVIPRGVVPREFRTEIDSGEVKEACGMHPCAPRILYTGRLVFQKGQDLLIEAIKECQPAPLGSTGGGCRGG
jgi:glycosyltransferase involved in cell wall biosynthesis